MSAGLQPNNTCANPIGTSTAAFSDSKRSAWLKELADISHIHFTCVSSLWLKTGLLGSSLYQESIFEKDRSSAADLHPAIATEIQNIKLLISEDPPQVE
jgi:hypothetical protein